MTTLAWPTSLTHASTVAPDAYYGTGGMAASDLAEPVRSSREAAEPNMTTAGKEEATDPAWIKEAMARMAEVVDLPMDWDGEGSPPVSAAMATIARWVLAKLQPDDSEAHPYSAPYVCPIPGGRVQFEWYSGADRFEIEFLDGSTVITLQWKDGEISQGRHSVRDTEDLRQATAAFFRP